jgi:hypothetical protein
MSTPDTSKPAGDPSMPGFLRREQPKQEPKQEPPPKQQVYEFHPIADIFEKMTGAEFDNLRTDIEENGLHEPIWLYEDKILDGRNRYLACKEAEVEIRTRPYTGDDPVGFVLSANFHRRHLDESQRAMVAARLVTTKLGDNQHIQREGRPIDLPTAAEMLNVSEKSVKRAKDVWEKGAPQLQKLVDSGQVAVSVAEKLANKLPKEQQAKIAKLGDTEVRKEAKKLGTPRTVKPPPTKAAVEPANQPTNKSEEEVGKEWLKALAVDDLITWLKELHDPDYLRGLAVALAKALTPPPRSTSTIAGIASNVERQGIRQVPTT